MENGAVLLVFCPAPSSNAVATREQRLYTTGLKDGKRPASCQGQDVNRLDIFSCVGVPAAHHHQRVVEHRHSAIEPSNRHLGHLHVSELYQDTANECSPHRVPGWLTAWWSWSEALHRLDLIAPKDVDLSSSHDGAENIDVEEMPL